MITLSNWFERICLHFKLINKTEQLHRIHQLIFEENLKNIGN
jgi:hypothetical protein